jgi:hypothetical protein
MNTEKNKSKGWCRDNIVSGEESSKHMKGRIDIKIPCFERGNL